MNAAATPSPSSLKIGIRDSGVGGLTVARCIRRLLPHASLLYFADTAHVPYGDRTPEEVRHYALSISQFLIEQGAQMVVFACNTSSAYALDAARERFSTPLFGMIEPGARAALTLTSAGETLGVLATQATVNSGVYTQIVQQLKPRTGCLEIACPEFVPLVENEETETPAAHRACAQALRPLREAGVQTVILGCTHYPLLLPVLRRLAPEMRFIDPAEAVAAEVAAEVQSYANNFSSNGGGGHDVFFVSGEESGVRHWINTLLPQNAESDVRRGPVFDLEEYQPNQNFIHHANTTS